MAVSPWPGKCFAQAATPVDCSPRVQAAVWAATREASAPKLRVPMTGLSGLLLTSASGREVEGDADGGELGADPAPDVLGEREVVDGAEGRGAEHRARLAGVQPADVAALLVDRDHRVRVGRS